MPGRESPRHQPASLAEQQPARAQVGEPSMDTPRPPTASFDDDSPLADSLSLQDSFERRGAAFPEVGEIVVFLDGQAETGPILEFACELAQEYGAHLTG